MKREPNLLPAPISGGATEEFITERASASPDLAVAKGARPRKSAGHVPAATAAPAELRALQEWFLAVVTDPKSVAMGVAKAAGPLAAAARANPASVITDGQQLTALERINLYHFAYHARLVECLADDYPAVLYALGERVFTALCRAYIIAYPSRHPNLISYGQNFAKFCEEYRGRLPARGFIAGLARLEWALVEVLHAQAAPTLDTEDLQAIPADQWAGMHFAPSATVRLLACDYPVNAFFQAFREGRAPAIPRPEKSATAVYRRGYALWRMDLVAPMALVLRELYAGKTLQEAIEAMAATIPDAEDEATALMQALMSRFREWTAGGFFAKIG